MSEVFPLWFRASFGLDGVFWESEFIPSFDPTVELVGGRVSAASAIIADCRVLRLTSAPGSPAWDASIALELQVVGWHAMQYLIEGEIRSAMDWVQAALGDDQAPIVPYLVALCIGETHIRRTHVEVHCSFTWVLYSCDRYTHSFRDLTVNLISPLSDAVIDLLDEEPELEYLAATLISWCTDHATHFGDVHDPTLLVGRLQSLKASGRLASELHMEVEIGAVVGLAKTDPVAAKERAAQLILGGDNIRGTELMMLYSLLVRFDPDVIVTRYREVLDVVDAVMRTDWSQRTEDRRQMADRRGFHWPIAANFAKALMEQGQPRLLGPLFGAWLQVGRDSWRTDILVCSISNVIGTGWATDRRVSTVGGPDLQELHRKATKFLGHWSDGRPGVPDADSADALEEALREVIDRERLRRVIADSAVEPTGLVLMPPLGISPQPIMIDEVGWSLPWSVSLETPKPDRPIERALVVCLTSGLLGAEVEAQSVSGYLATKGVEATVRVRESCSVDEFESWFSDLSWDLVWLIGHGEFDPSDARSVFLSLGGERLDSARLRDLSPADADRRRLLVLNVCDGASVVNVGGLPEHGLGAMCAQAGQAVVGHSWPVMSWPDAAVFGRLLAAQLVKHGSYYRAYEESVRIIRHGSRQIIVACDLLDSEADRIIGDAVSGRHGERLSQEFAAWGSSCFLE